MLKNLGSNSDEGDQFVEEGPEIIIIVMGITGSGKSTLINDITGRRDQEVGNNLDSCTTEIDTVDFVFERRRIKLVDTPGFDNISVSSTKVFQMIAKYLQNLYERNVYVNGIFYLQRVIDNRMTGSSIRQLGLMRNLVGDAGLKNVVLITTFWGKSDEKRGKAIVRDLVTSFWGPLLGHGARVFDYKSKKLTGDLIRSVLTSQRTILDLQRELVDERRTLLQTTAGRGVAEEIEEEISKLDDDLRDINLAMSELDGGEAYGGRRNSRSTLRGDELKHLTSERKVIASRISELKAELASLSDPNTSAMPDMAGLKI